MKIYTILFLSAITLSSCAQNTESTSEKSATATNSVHELSQASFKASFEGKEGLQIVDVRTPREIAGGKIGAAKELDYLGADFASNIESLGLDKTKPVVVYCAVGGRSSKAAQIFLAQGFTTVYNLQGGYSNYTK
jgi:rhodanese-related sulfurtransferase